MTNAVPVWEFPAQDRRGQDSVRGLWPHYVDQAAPDAGAPSPPAKVKPQPLK
ncbi:hypothetical protein LCGC14_0513570 [marine sediment metagenome]|uniref:Uncharacterized protein n=1 Tax=marine sediment metagenome TaxID=412755 RepID=A0A0F9S0D5_9ZZZZ